MTERILSAQLKQRQLDRAASDPQFVKRCGFRSALEHKATVLRIPDREMVLSYITCARCGARECDDATLRNLIARATDAENFFDLLDARGDRACAGHIS